MRGSVTCFSFLFCPWLGATRARLSVALLNIPFTVLRFGAVTALVCEVNPQCNGRLRCAKQIAYNIECNGRLRQRGLDSLARRVARARVCSEQGGSILLPQQRC